MNRDLVALVPLLRRALPRYVLTITIAGGLTACGAGEPAPSPAPPPTEQGAGGRAIGAQQSPDRQAIAAAVNFMQGYLAWQRGELGDVDDIPNASADLAEAIRRQRVPPAQRERDSAIAAVRLERIDDRSARVTVTVVNRDEDLTYPVPVDLQRTTDGRWLVLAAGTDL